VKDDYEIYQDNTMAKRTNSDLQNITHKTKDRVRQTPTSAIWLIIVPNDHHHDFLFHNGKKF
jgi:hypothetical protein